ncbi:MAG TPA: hypothetical protein ENJ09_05950 [Planctomycetes bacterium]|nr:hypothetical protein [Planctomycetota bacterium]
MKSPRRRNAHTQAHPPLRHTSTVLLGAWLLSACVGSGYEVHPLDGRAERTWTEVEVSRVRAASRPPTKRAGTVPAELLAILARVDEESSSIQAAYAGTRADREEVGVARSQYYGELTPFASTEHLDAPRLVSPLSPPIQIGSLPFDDDQYHLGIQARVPIDLNGRIGAEVRRAQDAHLASRAESDNLRLAVLHSASLLYWNLAALEGNRTALETQRRALEEHIRLAREAIRVGRLAEVELLRLQAELDGIEGSIAAVDGQEASLRANLAALMRVDAFDTSVTPAIPPPPALPDELGDWSSRPDLIAARLRVEEAAEAVRAAEARRLPDVAVGGSITHNAGYTADGDTISDIGIFLTWPAFDGGRRSSAARAARARYGAAKRMLEEVTDRARAEVLSARAAWKAAERRHAAAVSSTAAARRTTEIQAKRFDDGRLSATDLVDAEAAQRRAEAEVAASLAAWWAADDALQRALGAPPLGYREPTL